MRLGMGPEGKPMKDKGGEGRERRGQDPPEDEVPVLKPKTDEVLASAGLSRLLPGKHSVSVAPAAVATPCLSSLATKRLGSLRPQAGCPTLTSPCQTRRPLAVLVRTSSSMVSGTSGRLQWRKRVRGQKSHPGPTDLPNTGLTSWRRRGPGERGSRCHRSRLRTARGHLWRGSGGNAGSASYPHGASIPHGCP